MCNPYLMAPRDQVERCFRAIVPQGERSVVPLEPEQWASWFAATPAEAMDMLTAPPLERFDLADARRTDQLLDRS